MVRGRKTKRPRRSMGINLLRIGKAYLNAEILTRATTGFGVIGFVTGEQDIRLPVSTYSGSLEYVNPDASVSLADLIANPAASAAEMGMNLRKNFIPMTISSLLLNGSFKLGSKLLRSQRADINYLIRESVGKGVVRV